MGTCKRAVLEGEGLELGKFKFAGGARANNHLNIGRVLEKPTPRSVIISNMSKISLRYMPDLLLAIPSGGDEIADLLSVEEYLNVPVAKLKKVINAPGEKTFDYLTEEDRQKVIEAEDIVIVDDIFTRYTSLIGALAVDGVADRARAAVAVWDRGFPGTRPKLDIPTHALVTEYIPNFLRSIDEIHQFGVSIREEE